MDRLNLSDKFWEQFGVCDRTFIKQVGLYEIESIDSANIAMVAVNPKEYFENIQRQKHQ